ncbi:TauD/TfdA family dioxygenase [Myxococcota bacterium]|nr:TauD/TfdA family dioxygenase [Myxococcota bacterium]
MWQYSVRLEKVWTQEWRVGEVIIWDNRRVLHRRDEFDPNSRCLLKRCQVHARQD